MLVVKEEILTSQLLGCKLEIHRRHPSCTHASSPWKPPASKTGELCIWKIFHILCILERQIKTHESKTKTSLVSSSSCQVQNKTPAGSASLKATSWFYSKSFSRCMFCSEGSPKCSSFLHEGSVMWPNLPSQAWRSIHYWWLSQGSFIKA